MIVHNTDVALRNLTKYKLQTTISILSMAIGIVALAVVHSYVQTRLQPPPLAKMPYYDRACQLTIDSLHAERPENYIAVNSIKGDVFRALAEGGEFQCLESGLIYTDDYLTVLETYFNVKDSLMRKSFEKTLAMEPSYANFVGLRSARTGKVIGKLRPGEAIISETTARKIFGKENPVGKTVRLQWAFSLTIADVYVNHGCEYLPFPNSLLYAFPEGLSQDDREGLMVIWQMQGVLKKGCTPEQLEREANLRLNPLGWKAKVEWTTEAYSVTVRDARTMRTLSYLLAALILTAACIGFLRMQLQLFWMRKREMTLRIVNGAKRWDLFVLLMTEVGMVVVSAVAVALLLGLWLEPFINMLFINKHRDADILVAEHVLPYSAVLGLGLAAVFSLVVWFTLSRICRHDYNLAAGMRGARSHTFRNTMLWLQVSVGMLFVSVALFTAYACERMSQKYVLPEDDAPYRQSIFMQTTMAEDQRRLNKALAELPDVSQVIPSIITQEWFEEIRQRRDSLVKKYDWGIDIFKVYETWGTALLDFYRVETDWLRPELKGERCILIQEDMYAILEKEGVLANGILTQGLRQGRGSYPVAGTFKQMVFGEKEGFDQFRFIVMEPEVMQTEYILVPRPGHYDTLWSEVHQTIERLEPTVVKPMATNLYDRQGAEIEMLRNVRTAGWILGGMALLICLMGIYSTISLDTRARRKEVAIRKINGAKTGDIATLFARLYVLMIALALLVTLPLVAILWHFLDQAYYFDGLKFETPTVMGIAAAGCLMVILAIALIVGWHVRHIMRVNPAEMIAKE